MRRLAIFAMLLALVASMAPVQYPVRCVLQEHEYGHACCVPANRAMRAECCSPVIAAAQLEQGETFLARAAVFGRPTACAAAALEIPGAQTRLNSGVMPGRPQPQVLLRT